MPRLEAFFTHGDGPQFCGGIKASEDTKPSGATVDEASQPQDRAVLYLHGPPDAGQTSLLLQFGFTHAKSGKSVVLVMCGESGASQQPAASEIVPLMPCGRCGIPVQTGEDNETWRRIHIKYLRSDTELQHFLCSLHVVAKETSVLLIESFEKFFTNQSHMGSAYQTLAFLLEAREYMEASTGSGSVIVSGNTDAFLLRNRPMLRRWCKFLEIVPEANEPDVYALREEAEEANERGLGTQVQYEFSPPDSDGNGVFQLLRVQQLGDDR